MTIWFGNEGFPERGCFDEDVMPEIQRNTHGEDVVVRFRDFALCEEKAQSFVRRKLEVYREEKDRATEVATVWAIVQAAWRLKPPVMASTSRTSPAK